MTWRRPVLAAEVMLLWDAPAGARYEGRASVVVQRQCHEQRASYCDPGGVAANEPEPLNLNLALEHRLPELPIHRRDVLERDALRTDGFALTFV